jgi:hypothetical protein
MPCEEFPNALDISQLNMCIKWTDNTWATHLSYGNNVLLESRQLNVTQDAGCVQSFLWFCDEANFLAYEYKAREGAWMARKSGETRSRGKEGRRALKLEIRLRDNARGRAGVWRVY